MSLFILDNEHTKNFSLSSGSPFRSSLRRFPRSSVASIAPWRTVLVESDTLRGAESFATPFGHSPTSFSRVFRSCALRLTLRLIFLVYFPLKYSGRSSTSFSCDILVFRVFFFFFIISIFFSLAELKRNLDVELGDRRGGCGRRNGRRTIGVYTRAQISDSPDTCNQLRRVYGRD